jgi:hypothetical protein
MLRRRVAGLAAFTIVASAIRADGQSATSSQIPPKGWRALYVNAWAFGGSRFEQLMRIAETTEINALVIDVKDDTGYLTYLSSVPTAIAIGANKELRARDAKKRIAKLKQRNIRPIARIVVAKDPLLARMKPNWAIRKADGSLWTDRRNTPWVDAFSDSVWIYAAQLAREAVAMGFEEIQYDYVRFPDEPRSRMASAVYPARRGSESHRTGVTRNLKLLGERTRALGVPFTIDIFGLTTSAMDDMGIGQYWEDLVLVADAVLPMVYPSYYQSGVYGAKRPNAEPYLMVKRALQDAKRRSDALAPAKTADVRPYLQAFTLGAPRYTPYHVREQIRASEEMGYNSWVLWNPGSKYDPAAFRSGDNVPEIPPPSMEGHWKPIENPSKT